MRRLLSSENKKLEQKKQKILEQLTQLDPNQPEEAEILDDYQGQIDQIEENQRDIYKKLRTNEITTDFEQLSWLKTKLIESWHTEGTRGRVIYLHHPPYVTEATKWNQGQTLEVRRRLRQVLDEVAKVVREIAGDRPIVDLVLSGHAHCLEHLYTKNTGHGDSFINWIICGGSGHSLRRQRSQGSLLTEENEDKSQAIAESKLFLGRNGHGSHKKRAKATAKNIEGKAQEALGKVTGDPEQQAKGKAKQAEAEVEHTVEDAKDALK
jgi:uncharacterized protein YjbJ (UPF0337 family)